MGFQAPVLSVFPGCRPSILMPCQVLLPVTAGGGGKGCSFRRGEPSSLACEPGGECTRDLRPGTVKNWATAPLELGKGSSLLPTVPFGTRGHQPLKGRRKAKPVPLQPGLLLSCNGQAMRTTGLLWSDCAQCRLLLPSHPHQRVPELSFLPPRHQISAPESSLCPPHPPPRNPGAEAWSSV